MKHFILIWKGHGILLLKFEIKFTTFLNNKLEKLNNWTKGFETSAFITYIFKHKPNWFSLIIFKWIVVQDIKRFDHFCMEQSLEEWNDIVTQGVAFIRCVLFFGIKYPDSGNVFLDLNYTKSNPDEYIIFSPSELKLIEKLSFHDVEYLMQ